MGNSEIGKKVLTDGLGQYESIIHIIKLQYS